MESPLILVCHKIILWLFPYNGYNFPLQVMFQYSVRHSPLRIDDLVASISSSDHEGNRPPDVEMDG